jgi:hypothetical protein
MHSSPQPCFRHGLIAQPRHTRNCHQQAHTAPLLQSTIGARARHRAAIRTLTCARPYDSLIAAATAVVQGQTPLHHAASTNHIAVIERLVDKGADVNAANAVHARPPPRPHLTLHTSLFIPHPSLLVLHTPLFTSHSSHLVLHTPLFTSHSSHLVRHTSLFTPGPSHLVLHTSSFTPRPSHLVIYSSPLPLPFRPRHRRLAAPFSTRWGCKAVATSSTNFSRRAHPST